MLDYEKIQDLKQGSRKRHGLRFWSIHFLPALAGKVLAASPSPFFDYGILVVSF